MMNGNQFRADLSEIGRRSLLIINESHKSLGKGKIWENAVKINNIAHNLHKTLKNTDYIFNEKTTEEEKRWEDPTQWG